MALTIGDSKVTSGMAGSIYKAMDDALRPALKSAGLSDDDITSKIAPSWRSLSFAIASGVVDELTGASSAAPDFAQTFSSATQDATFWSWLAGFVAVFQTWQPTPSDGGASLKAALTAFLAGNPVPATLSGVIQ